MKSILDYPTKIWMAFGETMTGNEKIHQWLLENGYPELAALSSSIQGSEEALKWLTENGFVEFAILDAAIDEQPSAMQWLKKYGLDIELKFAAMCNKDQKCIAYFNSHDLKIFIHLANKINEFRDNMIFDVHRRPKC
ncbi:MAG: hypothetical protein ACEPOW_00310 [Bacteroidales bacterium]